MITPIILTYFTEQLEKMGILPEKEVKVAAPSTAKRKTAQTDFSKLGPLKNTGTRGFSSYRDNDARPKKAGAKNGNDNAMDSDDDNDDDEEPTQIDEDDKAEGAATAPNPEDLEVSEGVRQIKVTTSSTSSAHGHN